MALFLLLLIVLGVIFLGLLIGISARIIGLLFSLGMPVLFIALVIYLFFA